MTISRVDFANGYASVYNEFGKKVRAIPCTGLVGYGPKGAVVKRGTLYAVVDLNCCQRMLTVPQFAKEQWTLHDDYLQMRCSE